jgi:large subunit ribosomal protein L24
MLARVKLHDTVVVLSGKDRGKQGAVVAIDADNQKIMVKDVALITRHIKAKKAGDFAGIKKEESFIPMAKVMPVCPHCKKPCRVNARRIENGSKVRVCNQCEQAF